MKPAVESLGQPIRGSRYYRNFCWLCGDPIRVIEELRFRTHVACEGCRPHPLKILDNIRHSRLISTE
jgi:hypothetical protein